MQYVLQAIRNWRRGGPKLVSGLYKEGGCGGWKVGVVGGRWASETNLDHV